MDIRDAILLGITAGGFWCHLFLFHWQDIKNWFSGRGK